MTLNSTGLGIGASPSRKLSVSGAAAGLDVTDTTQSTRLRIRSSSASNFFIEALNSTESAYVTLRLNDTTQIDSSGNVGVGVTPSAWNLLTGKTIQLQANASISGGLTHSTYLGQNWFYDGTNSNYIVTGRALLYEQNKSSGNHAWYTAVSGTGGTTATMTQAMTLDASGNLLVGTTSGSFGSRLIISADSGTTSWATGPLPAGPSNYYITANNTQGVFLNGTSATAWTAISDERFKDIIEPITNAVSKVGSLRSVIGKFKTDAEGTRRSFLIAQDVIAVFPEAVVATDPDKLGVTYTEIIPLLVAAIKELTARVQTLEAK
jgi:hypothetical protein